MKNYCALILMHFIVYCATVKFSNIKLCVEFLFADAQTVGAARFNATLAEFCFNLMQ